MNTFSITKNRGVSNHEHRELGFATLCHHQSASWRESADWYLTETSVKAYLLLQARRTRKASQDAAASDVFWKGANGRALGVSRPVGHYRHLPRVFGSAPRPSAPDAHPDSRLIVSHTAHECAEVAPAEAVNGTGQEEEGVVDSEHAGGGVKSCAADVAARIAQLRQLHLSQQWAHLVSKDRTSHNVGAEMMKTVQYFATEVNTTVGCTRMCWTWNELEF